MIEYKEGNIFTSLAQTITNTVNLVGVMGAGLALVHKAIFPRMYQTYRNYCKAGQFKAGQLWVWDQSWKWQVLNFPTKRHWRDWSEIPLIEMGLMNLVRTYQERGITSLAIPLLGCQNGHLKEKDVLPVMEKWLGQMNIPVEIWRRNPDAPNPIWNELKFKCSAGKTTFERIVLECESFEDLVNRPGIGRDSWAKETGKILGIEKDDIQN